MYIHKAKGKIYYNVLLQLNQSRRFISILGFILFPDAGRSRDRIPVGERFSAQVQNGPGAYPASYTMGTGSFPGVKRTERGANQPPHLAPRLKIK
jgi:hypothetical protein